MCRPLHCFAAGATAVVAAAGITFSGLETSDFLPFSEAEAMPGIVVVDRAQKGNRLPGAAIGQDDSAEVVTVEVIGLRSAAIIYRARDGRILFQTDPVANATVVAKGVSLPEITIRQARRPTPQPVPPTIETVPVPQGAPAASKPEPKILEGCDLAFSPLVASKSANFTGRCLAALSVPVRVAEARL